MIDVTDLRAGTTFQINGNPYQVLKYNHVKLGRGNANIKIEARNLKTGGIEQKTFVSGAKVEEVETDKKSLKYLYRTSSSFIFFDQDIGEEVEINREMIGSKADFFKKGEAVNVLFWKDQPLSVELPQNVILEVVDTDPGVRGNSAVNIWKPARTETGLIVKVPLFVNTGDKIKVDTRTGEYAGRT